MPYEIVENHDGCPEETPVAVVNTEDGDVMGCHASTEDAMDQMRALMESEGEEEESASVDLAVPVVAPGWAAVLVRLGEPTDDYRVFDEIKWRDLPLSLMWQTENWGGHDGAVIVGQIAQIQVDPDGKTVRAAGIFDVEGQFGAEAYRLVRAGMLKGISIDAAPYGDAYVDEEDVTHYSGTILAATLVPTPAFAYATIELIDAQAAAVESLPEPQVPIATMSSTQVLAPSSTTDTASTFDLGPGLTIVASGRPVLPAAAFARPPMTGREGIHVDEDGRVWGHIYGWGECHIGSPAGRCIRPTPSATNYAYFLVGSVLTEDGEVAVGQITLNADHAPTSRTVGWMQARDHYANTGLVVADVTCGEDEYGIWIAGMIRDGVAPDVLHAFYASQKVSGDWRPVGKGLELVGILTVNTPGYPYRRLAAHIEDGRVTALVASASLTVGEDCGCDGGMSPLLDDVLSRLTVLEAERDARQAEMLAAQAEVIAALERELGLDPDSLIAGLEADLAALDA